MLYQLSYASPNSLASRSSKAHIYPFAKLTASLDFTIAEHHPQRRFGCMPHDPASDCERYREVGPSPRPRSQQMPTPPWSLLARAPEKTA